MSLQGKIKIKVTREFYLDEPEMIEPKFLIDDLRRIIHEGHS